ncbi:MAG TPA: substrate-binding domain-containing protein [Planctomycetaceae bacterium]|nr:substrate-binding domain-containing protein [Planctomycetaceae bacterium]
MISALGPPRDALLDNDRRLPPACAGGSPGRLSILAVLAIVLAGCGQEPAATGTGANHASGAPKPRDQIVIAMLPKLTNIAYFRACEEGAKKAAAELGVRLVYDGPTDPSASDQNNFIKAWTRQGVDAICVAPNEPKAIKRVVDEARQHGIKVLTWDSDAPDSGRDLMVNQVDDKRLGEALMDEIARQMHEEGEWAVVIASLNAENLNTWRRYAEARAAEKYPKLTKVDTVVTEEDVDKSRKLVETLLNVHPNLKGMIAFDSNSVPGAAEALKRTGKAGKVALCGNTTPAPTKAYLKEGVLQSFFLWDPRQLGDLTVRLAVALVEGNSPKASQSVNGSPPLTFSPRDPTTVIMSTEPLKFTKENIDRYDWGF